MGLNEESAKLKNSLKKIIKECIKEEEKSCFRLYKAVVKTVPDGSTCGVQVLGDNNIINLKYSTAVSGVDVNDLVWVATIYNSFSNAIVFATIDFRWAGYKVGDVYMSFDSTSPAQLFGGYWEQITDTFLLAAGTSYAAGSVGGEATHTLTIDEMPAHYHGFQQNTNGTGEYNYAPTQVENVEIDFIRTTTEGGSQPHNNMPPYLAVYIWKRIPKEYL